MDGKEQELLAQVLDLFASEFAEKALLRGGMVLKVMGSARYTNDLDYLFVPYKSKNDITDQILACLKKIEGNEISYTLNSKCLRVIVALKGVSIQIEAKVALEMKSTVISTRLFSPQFNLPKRLIHIVDHSVSLANKLAAWNERRLARDLYDIWFFLQMQIVPDAETLLNRLRKPLYSKLVKKEQHFRGKSIPEFYDFLRFQVGNLTDKEIEDQLSDYLAPEELAGLVSLIRSALVRLEAQPSKRTSP